MLSFRYHVASLVAVLLALAAGVALGAGPLQRDSDGTGSTGTTGTSAYADQQAAKLGADFADSVRAELIGGALAGRAITLVELPGAPAAAVKLMTTALTDAGAQVLGPVTLGDKLLSASDKQLVDSLGAQLEQQTGNVKVPTGASTYERIGALLGYALTTKTAGGDAADQQATGVLSATETAGLLKAPDGFAQRGSLVLVVAGPPGADKTAAKGTASILASLVRALDATSAGVVVAGTAGTADEPGALSGIRSDSIASQAVSTVDTANTAPGAIVTVLALAEQAAGGVGQYGVGTGATAVRPGVD